MISRVMKIETASHEKNMKNNNLKIWLEIQNE